MAQDDRHLTTEQLSAYLDGQVSSEEHAQCDRHLQTCEQCRQGLASLRQTVALLHALPQPVLPRSFVLSPTSATQYAANVQSMQDDPITPISLETHRAARQTGPAVKLYKRRSRYVQGALRGLSALAAVAGLLLFISGLVTGVTQGTAMSTSSGSSSAPFKQDYPAAAPVATPEPAITSQTSTGANMPNNTKVATTPQMTPQLKPVPTAEIKKILPTTPTLIPELPFFDSNAPSGRVGSGMLLILLGVMGFIVFRQRRGQSPQDK